MRASAVTTRRTRAVESFRNVAETLGPIEPGMSLFAITRGQWSMIDAMLYCLDQVGEAALSVWTLTIAQYEVETLTRLRTDTRLTEGLLVIDHGARVKNAAILAEWQGTFGPSSVRYVLNHAKIATITSASGLRLLLRGSMNLNFNPRFEQFDLTEGGDDYTLVHAIEQELPILAPTYTGQQAYAATKLNDVFDQQTLAMFGAHKVWQK